MARGHRARRNLMIPAALLLGTCASIFGCVMRERGDASTAGAAATAPAATGPRWVGTWACAPQLTEPSNLPPAPGLAGNTLRQVVAVSIGGTRLRLRLSNAHGDGPVTLRAVHLALSTGDSGIDATTDHGLLFAGAPAVTLPAGQTVFSDPFEFALAPLGRVAVSIQFGATPAGVTGHPGSRTTSYLQAGDAAGAAHLPDATRTDHWYYLTGLDVFADAGSDTAAVVVLGDSLTDGRGSTTNGQNRWPDNLARRLQANAATRNVAVLNQGIGGNAVLDKGLGLPATQRFGKDVVGQSGARWVLILHGVNDIGMARDASVAMDLTAAYARMADVAHEAGLRVYVAPLLPFGGSHYDSPEHQLARQTVNDWLRGSGLFDAVIGLDRAVADPANPSRLLAAYDSGDHLHLNAAGYQAMADAVDLSLFARRTDTARAQRRARRRVARAAWGPSGNDAR